MKIMANDEVIMQCENRQVLPMVAHINHVRNGLYVVDDDVREILATNPTAIPSLGCYTNL